jgi:AGCS family alanine or glycine:cation symporter
LHYRILYVLAFFLAAFTDTTIVWAVSYITIAFMAVPNLIGILILHKEIKETIREYWRDFRSEHPDEKSW